MTRPTRGAFRWRVVAGMVGAVVASLILLGVTSVVGARRELRNNAERAALEETRAALGLVEDRLADPDPTSVAELNTELREIGDFEVLAVVDGQEVRSDVGIGLADVPHRLRDPDTTTRTATVETVRGPFLVTATRSAPGVDYYLLFPLDRLHEDVTTLTQVVVATGAVAALVLLAGTLVISRRVLRPVDETAAAARQLASGVLGARVAPSAGSFADVGEAFNDMARALQQMVERLAAMEARQRQFVADVAHELRTPLTALATAADLLEPAVEGLDGAQRRAAATLITETRRLRETVLDLMELSRLDAGGEAVEPQRVRVARLLHQLVGHHPRAEDVQVEVQGDPVAMADPVRVHTILRNLVDNALEHGAAPVSVTARSTPGRVEIEIVDRGDGVGDAVRDRIFERFVKGDPTRGRGRGSGLGLAIARDHARLLGGDVVLLDQRPGEGARFLVTLPAAPPTGPAGGRTA